MLEDISVPAPPVVPELMAERGSRPPKSRLHRANRAAHDIGNFLVGEALKVEQDDRARVLGQAHQRLFNLLAHDRAQALQFEIAS
jgi:hypothetical protein